MNQENKTINLPASAVMFFSTVLVVTAFFAGYLFFQLKGGNTAVKSQLTAKTVFAAKKSAKPELQFYVMSFCPYGNQAEEALKPVAELLKDKVNIRPQYIFNKIDNLDSYCAQSSGDPNQCAVYVQNKYFSSEAECKKVINDNLAACKDDKAYIKSSTGAMYGSLHGRVEANQNVRELCAWNQASDKMQWWKYVDLVNKNCSSQNADTCWEQQAKDAGFDTGKISECFNKDAISLIEKEIELTTTNKVSGSPTFMVNGVAFPGDEAYGTDGKGTLKVGDQVFSADQFRSPNALKEAVCASFDKAPKECKTQLEMPASTNGAAAQGGC